jgi:hypothetical protein
MASPAVGSRHIALEETLQWRVNEARQRFEDRPTDEARVKLQRALQVLMDLIFDGKTPSDE